MANWRDNVPTTHGILWTAKRETEKGTGYVVNRFRYGADKHRAALFALVDRGLLRKPLIRNPYLIFRITNNGRHELNRLELINKKGVFG